MEDKKEISQTIIVFSKTNNIRIHDRRKFKKDPEKDKNLLDKLLSHEQRAKPKQHMILKTPKQKPVTNCYDVSAIKNIVNTMDDELLALIMMHADPAKVCNGLKKLSEESNKNK